MSVRAARLCLLSPLPLDECCRRLQAAMDSNWAVFGSKPVVGSVANGRLRARKRISGRNSFQTLLTAELVAQADGTLILCRFGMHGFVVVFMTLWLGMVGVLGLGFAASSVAALASGEPGDAGTWLGLLVPAAMGVFGVGLLQLGRYMAGNERQVLTDFVCDTLEAGPRQHA